MPRCVKHYYVKACDVKLLLILLKYICIISL